MRSEPRRRHLGVVVTTSTLHPNAQSRRKSGRTKNTFFVFGCKYFFFLLSHAITQSWRACRRPIISCSPAGTGSRAARRRRRGKGCIKQMGKTTHKKISEADDGKNKATLPPISGPYRGQSCTGHPSHRRRRWHRCCWASMTGPQARRGGNHRRCAPDAMGVTCGGGWVRG